jgi:hypothetical protein
LPATTGAGAAADIEQFLFVERIRPVENAYVHIHRQGHPMTRWNLVIADETDRHVRSYLARTGGKKGDLSRFVDRAVRQAIFWETVESVWERNRSLSGKEVRHLAEEAVAQVRAYRS